MYNENKNQLLFLMILLSQSPAVHDVTSRTMSIELSMTLPFLSSLWYSTVIPRGVMWLQSPKRRSGHNSVDLARQTSSINTTFCNMEIS